MAENSGEVLVVAAPGDTQDAILAAVAAQGLAAEVLSELDAVPANWRRASTVLVADSCAEQLVGLAPTHRSGVFLVGPDPVELALWSAPLAAQVIPLPEGRLWLGSALAEGVGQARAPVCAVVGGSGGVGASTLAAAVARVAADQLASRGGGVALVDVDPLGGGIDLLLGAEHTGGWRWPRLNTADGQLGDLRPHLPVIDGVSVVAMARGPAADLAREPLAAVVAALRVWHDLVVLDAGRSLAPAAREALRLASRQLVVVGPGVRGAAAARQTVLTYGLERAELLVRGGVGGLPLNVVADAVGAPVLARLPQDPRLVTAADRGEPPLRGARARYRKAVAGIVAGLGVAG